MRSARLQDGSPTVGNVALFIARTLMASLFFQCALGELGRLYLSDENYDIDPDDCQKLGEPASDESLGERHLRPTVVSPANLHGSTGSGWNLPHRPPLHSFTV